MQKIINCLEDELFLSGFSLKGWFSLFFCHQKNDIVIRMLDSELPGLGSTMLFNIHASDIMLTNPVSSNPSAFSEVSVDIVHSPSMGLSAMTFH